MNKIGTIDDGQYASLSFWLGVGMGLAGSAMHEDLLNSPFRHHQISCLRRLAFCLNQVLPMQMMNMREERLRMMRMTKTLQRSRRMLFWERPLSQ